MISNIFESELAWRLGWVLLHSLWQVALVGALAAVVLGALKRRSPQLRYAVACGAMAAMFLPLIGTFWFVDADLMRHSALAAQRTTDPESSATEVSTQVAAITPASPNTDSSAASGQPESSLGQTSFVAGTFRWLADRVAWIVAVWLAGCVSLSIWNLGAWIAAVRLRRLAAAPAAEHLQRRLAEIASRMRIGRSVELLSSLLVQTPIMIGYLRPAILLPATLHTYLTATELDALLAHELAHIRRHDYLVNLLQTLTETLLFFHPAVWWLSARIRAEREYCCDDVAASYSGRIEYARALASVATSCQRPKLALAASGQRSGIIVDRVRRVLGAPPIDGSSWLGGALLGLITFVPLAVGLSLAVADDEGAVEARPRSQQRSASTEPIGFTAPQDVTLAQGRQKPFAGIVVELQRRRGTPSLRFVDLHSLRVERKMWTDKSAQEMWKEYKEGGFAILPGERGAWIPLGGELPIVIYLGGVGLVEVREYSERNPLTVNLRFKLLELPPGYLGQPLGRDDDPLLGTQDDVRPVEGKTPRQHLPDDYGIIHEVRLTESDNGKSTYFDLDRGRLVELLPGKAGAARNPAADLATSLFLSDSRTLVTVEMATIAVGDEVFDAPRPDAEAIHEVLQRPLKSGTIVGGKHRTWYFRTAEQNVGVMQIVPVRDKPREKVVRWRLSPRNVKSADQGGEDRERAARLAAEKRKAEGTREVFRPTTRGSGKTSWSNAFPAQLAGGVKGHMMLVHAHRGDRWPVKLRGATEPLFHAELLDGDDAAVTIRMQRAGEKIERTLKRDQPQEVVIRGKKCRIAFASTTTAKTDEPLLVDHATIVVEVFQDAAGDDTSQSAPSVDQ